MNSLTEVCFIYFFAFLFLLVVVIIDLWYVTELKENEEWRIKRR